MLAVMRPNQSNAFEASERNRRHQFLRYLIFLCVILILWNGESSPAPKKRTGTISDKAAKYPKVQAINITELDSLINQDRSPSRYKNVSGTYVGYLAVNIPSSGKAGSDRSSTLVKIEVNVINLRIIDQIEDLYFVYGSLKASDPALSMWSGGNTAVVPVQGT